VLLNYHLRRFVLGSLRVGDLVRLVLSGVRVVGWSFGLQQPEEGTNGRSEPLLAGEPWKAERVDALRILKVGEVHKYVEINIVSQMERN